MCTTDLVADVQLSIGRRIRATGSKRTAKALFSAGALVAACVAPALSDAERVVNEPPLAKVHRGRPVGGGQGGAGDSGAPAPRTTTLGEAALDLTIRYTEARIYDPGTDKYDTVRLRSYRDTLEAGLPKVPFVAPTLEISPGETVRVTLRNELPPEPGCEAQGHDANVPSCFNRTNLHTHGLSVSPAGNGDNVLLSINPNVRFQYEFNVPSDHPTGTFWYHPHRHGSTALQVSSGMAGVLIVRGRRLPTPEASGDVDTLLARADGTPLRERVVLLQQIQYACRDKANAIKKDASGLYLCDPGDTGGIEGYDQFGPPTWRRSGRYTSMNGEVAPTFVDARVGEIERWRIVHAGVRDTINLQFRKMRPGADPYARVSEPRKEDWLARNCDGPDLVPQFALAADGLTRSQIVERTTSFLQPGYREDVLVTFPEAGDYCILDAAAPAVSTVNNQAKSRQYLGKVAVSPGPRPDELRRHLQDELLASAERTMPSDVRQKVRDDLSNGLRLSSFVSHADIGDAEVRAPEREATFQIGPPFTINGKAYDPSRIDVVLPLGGVEQWKLSTVNAFGHPFHIHVNPFQIARIVKDSTGEDVSETGDPAEPQYAGLKGVWKDTLFIRQGYTAFVRTRYERYIGDFVLHCHILDHEDQGMMQNVRVAIPDGRGGLAAFGHH